MSPRSQVPFRAINLSVCIQVLLGLINIGSSAAFLAFVNATAVTLYITYVRGRITELLRLLTLTMTYQITPVILGVMKRRRGEPIPYGPFQLGRFRGVINGVAIVYTLFTTFFLLWPATAHPDASTMNWTIVLIGGVLTFSCPWWFVDGRKSFAGPDLDATLNNDHAYSVRHLT